MNIENHLLASGYEYDKHIEKMEKHQKEEKETWTVSSCCGEESFELEDYGICPICKDHCDYIKVDENGNEIE